MGESVTLHGFNLLELGAVAVNADADTGYPASRLYDRSKGLIWKTSGGEQELSITVEQVVDLFGYSNDDFGWDGDGFGREGAPGLRDIDTLWVGGHNFAGHEIVWESSENGTDWTERSRWWQSDDDPIVQVLGSAVTAQFWRLRVEEIGGAECGEIIMTEAVAIGIRNTPAPMHDHEPAVVWSRSLGGLDRSIKYGDSRAMRRYVLDVTAANLTDFQAFVADLDEFSRPFLVKDKDDAYRLMRFSPVPAEDYFSRLRTRLTLDLVEVF